MPFLNTQKIKKVKKRDGKEVLFDGTKILNAISKANDEVADKNKRLTASDLVFVTEKIIKKLNKISDEQEKRTIFTIEEIQDIVEKKLIQYYFPEVAKKYILYRSERAKIRNSATYLFDTFRVLTEKEAIEENQKRENANIDCNSAMGTMLKFGTVSSNYYVDNYILPKRIAQAHIDGDIHIHDKDFYLLTETCCQIDLLKLFKLGFSTGHGFLREPNSIISAAALACIAIQANQNEMHGGQAVPHFDYCMAPYVLKTYRKEYVEAFCTYLRLSEKIPLDLELFKGFDDMILDMQEKITIGNVADVTFNECEFLQHYRDSVSDAHWYAVDQAEKKTQRATYQAMEALIHNLNTMNSRAGAQVPFSSINYGTDISPEGRMVIECLLRATQAGLGNGETPIFPVQIFKVKEGVNFNEGDPNYDLFKLAMETSAKRLFPNFSFLDAPFNKQFYKEGDWNSEVAYMGCRTRVMGNVYDPSRQVTCGRGNLSFTSINLPRIALKNRGKDFDAFMKELTDMVLLVFEQLKLRLKVQSKRKVLNYPFLMGNGIWLDSDKLDWHDTVGEVLKHGTLTVGFIGLAECLKVLCGKHHGESDEAQEMGLKIIKHMRELCDQESQKDKLNFSLLATPAESLSGRFVALDKKEFGIIEGVTDRDYYTNSFHVPVYYPIRAFRKIHIEAPYHEFTNGGHITYVELDGDPSKNMVAFEAIIRCMHDYGVGYGSINHPVDRDPICGYTGIIGDTCPRCGRKEGESVSIEKLNELRKKYPSIPKYE